MIVNYKSWINIVAIALNLLNNNTDNKDVVVQSKWIDLNDIGLSKSSKEALQVDFIYKNNNIPLKTFILIPWQNFIVDNENIIAITFNLKFVTPFAVIYEKFNQSQLSYEEKSFGYKIEYVFERTFDIFECNEILNAKDNYTLLDNIQVISHNEYLYHVELNVAKPGSGNIQYDKLKEVFPGKMVKLSVIPDVGITDKQWVKGNDPVIVLKNNNFVTEFEQVFTHYFDTATTVYSLVELMNQFDLMKINYSISEKDVISKYIYKLFDFQYADLNPISSGLVYDDYHPKNTPDLMLDYMPSLNQYFEKFPEADIVHLEELIELFEKYEILMNENIGVWEEGNVLLGARDKEYLPTKYELILNEIGNRLETVQKENHSDSIAKVVTSLKALNRKYIYKNFSFIHYDVMGSGRFFYVDFINTKTLKLVD